MLLLQLQAVDAAGSADAAADDNDDDVDDNGVTGTQSIYIA